MSVCPTCNRRIVVSRGSGKSNAVNLCELNDDQLRAHYKETAPYLDLLFLIDHSADYPETLDRASRLMDARFRNHRLIGSRADFYREYRNVHQSWRRESNARERIEYLREKTEREARELAALEQTFADTLVNVVATDEYDAAVTRAQADCELF